jgi:hypothetical protein
MDTSRGVTNGLLPKGSFAEVIHLLRWCREWRATSEVEAELGTLPGRVPVKKFSRDSSQMALFCYYF